MRIDFHTHAFPDALAPRAMQTLGARAGVQAHTDGTVDSLLALMERCGVDTSVVCNISTNLHQQPKVNQFAVSLMALSPRIIPLGSVHPECEEPFPVLSALRKEGILGIKLHADYMGYRISDPIYGRILDACRELGMFIVLHAGMDVYSPDLVHATPAAIAKVQRDYPELRIVAAHLGGLSMWEEAERELVGTGTYLDTSMMKEGGLPPESARRMILRHDPDRILFASDAPWGNPADGCTYLESLGLPEDLLDRIYAGNAIALLNEQERKTV